MKPGMKMLMVANRGGKDKRSDGRESGDRGGTRNAMNYPYSGGHGDTEYETTRNEYNGSDMNYGVEGRFRDRRGREHYDNGRYAPRSEYTEPYGNYGMDGRHPMDAGYPMTPYVPPIYNNDRNMEEYRPMNRIGFESREEVRSDYKTDANYPRMDEMNHRTSPMTMGHAKGSGDMKLTHEMADEWMAGLQNEDGTRGPHWTFEQVKQVMAQKGVKAEPLEFFVILNAMYADYCKVFKKYGVGDKLDFYVDMAKAFIEDKDAGEGKVANYFHSIVKR